MERELENLDNRLERIEQEVEPEKPYLKAARKY